MMVTIITLMLLTTAGAGMAPVVCFKTEHRCFWRDGKRPRKIQYRSSLQAILEVRTFWEMVVGTTPITTDGTVERTSLLVQPCATVRWNNTAHQVQACLSVHQSTVPTSASIVHGMAVQMRINNSQPHQTLRTILLIILTMWAMPTDRSTRG